MKWSEGFEVGHNRIDLEHKVFFNLVQSLEMAELEKLERDKVRRLIAEIEKYAEFHFLSEENIMLDFEYPDYASHHQHHQELMSKLEHYIISFESGVNNINELVKFLYKWFINHTTNEDLALTQYIHQLNK